ncbi:hypothetical protein MC885_001890 [Smutsia gigantea]|nr:hypothetical protein MC885_001890 [Smutsia gigantea]
MRQLCPALGGASDTEAEKEAKIHYRARQGRGCCKEPLHGTLQPRRLALDLRSLALRGRGVGGALLQPATH